MKPYILVVLITASVGACSSLTNVDAPDVTQPNSLASAAGADVLRAGAVGKFAATFSGSLSPISEITDELFSARPGGGTVRDQRLMVVLNGYDYAGFQATRVNALRAIAAYQAYAPGQRTRIGQMFAIAGIVEISFAEHVCSGVPLSQFVGSAAQYGAPLTTTQMFQQALADFDSAVAYGGSDAVIGSLARIGRARALIGLDRAPEAGAAVASVPTTFLYQTEHSTSVQPNLMARDWLQTKQITVADREGSNGLDFLSSNDPRIPVTNLGTGFDGQTTVWLFTKYNSIGAPIVVASGVEARLIEAEAALKAGQAQNALDILNALRTTVSGLAPLTLQSTVGARVDQLFRERAFWLFLTGHRLGDLRRLMRQYGRLAQNIFPVGPYRDGLTYGADVNFPVDPAETNNPNFTGCLDRSS
jgi:hypothetical protein